MTPGDFGRLWRDRRENPLAMRRWGLRKVAAVASIILGSMLLTGAMAQFIGSFELVLLGFPAIVILLLPLIFQCFLYPISMPRQGGQEKLEELVLTRMSRDEVAFGLVYAALKPVLVVLFLEWLVFLAWFSASEAANVQPPLQTILILMIVSAGLLIAPMLMVIIRGLCLWQENPTRHLRNALLTSLQAAWLWGHLAGLVIIALVARDRFRGIPGPGSPIEGFVDSMMLDLVAGLLLFFLSILLLRNVRRIWAESPGTWGGRIVLLVGGLLLLSSGLPLLTDNPDIEPCIITAILVLYLFPLLLAPLRFLTERALCRVYPEEYQDACWSAPDDPRRGEWRDRIALARALLLRLGSLNFLRENVGVLLSGILLLAAGGVMAFIGVTRLALDPDGVGNADPFAAVWNMMLNFTATPALGILLTVVRLWNESRLHPGRRIPVVKGAILMSSFVYIAVPFAIAMLHGIVSIHLMGRSEWDVMLLMVPITFLLCLATALYLIPSRGRGRRILLVSAITLFLHMTTQLLSRAWEGSRFNPFGGLVGIKYLPDLGGEMELFCSMMLFALLLISALGIPALAQRVHDEETRGVPRFGVTGSDA